MVGGKVIGRSLDAHTLSTAPSPERTTPGRMAPARMIASPNRQKILTDWFEADHQDEQAH